MAASGERREPVALTTTSQPAASLGSAARRLLLADDAYARARHGGVDRATLAGLEWHRLEAFAELIERGASVEVLARVLDLSVTEIASLLRDTRAAGLLPPDDGSTSS